MLVTASLANLAVAHGQRGTEVVQHQSVQLVAGTLLAHVVAAQLAELGQLLVGQLDGRLEHDPDHRLEERWRRQRAQIGPVGLGVGQQARGIEASGNGDAVVLVRDELQQLHDLIEALVVLSALDRREGKKRVNKRNKMYSILTKG